MSQRNGDRSRFNRIRKAKIARRARWRTLLKKSVDGKPVLTSGRRTAVVAA